MQEIPIQNGFNSVKSAEAEYKSAKAALDAIHRKQDEWGGIIPVEIPNAKTQEKRPVCLNSWQGNSIELMKKIRQSAVNRSTAKSRKAYGDECL